MVRLLGVSAVVANTGATDVVPVLKIKDGAGVILAAYVAELVSAGAASSLVVWSQNQAADLTSGASAGGTLTVARGFLPPDSWLPPNWQLSIEMTGAAAPTQFSSAQMTFLAPE